MSDSFPIMWQSRYPRRKRPERLPHTVPWAVVAPHREQATKNHTQTLERLAERGGLCPQELIAVLTNCSWTETVHLSDEAAVDHLLKLLAERCVDDQG